MRIRTRRDMGMCIRELRRARGLTQARLAELAGASRRWVGQVEQGKTSAELGALLRTLRVLGADLHVRPTRAPDAAAELSAIIDATPRSRG